jgi:hypothetical protein
MQHSDVPAAIAKIEAAHAARQKKLVNLDVVETSGVAHPAHLHEGWVVAKSAGPARTVSHQHLPEVHYLTLQEQETARGFYGTDLLKSGESVQNGEASIKRDICGCLFMVTPESVQKAADDDIVRQLGQNRRGRTADIYLTPEEVAYLMGGEQK